MINVTEIQVHMTRNGNMTKKALAEKIGVSPATLGRWLENKDMPTSAAEKIAEILKIPSETAANIFFAVM